jgi:hypothetical protein
VTLPSLALVFLCGLVHAQEPAADTPAASAQAPVVAVTRLPVVADQLRERDVSEAELRALLETALGSGVAVADLVVALEVVVAQLDEGIEMPDLALRLPGLIGQGHVGDALAATLQAVGPTAAAALPVALVPDPEPSPEAAPSSD